MAKTKGAYVASEFVHKIDTPINKYAFIVYGKYMETSAVSLGRAQHAIRARYNKAHGRNATAWVDMTSTEVRNKPVQQVNKPTEVTKPEKLEPVQGSLLDFLLDQK